MILHDTVRVGLNPTNYDYWVNKGYVIDTYVDSRKRTKTFKRGSFITVKVTDLPQNSNVKVTAKCISCGLIRKLSYFQYADTCWKCNLLKQKGPNHPRYLEKVAVRGPERAFELYLNRKYNITYQQYYDTL